MSSDPRIVVGVLALLAAAAAPATPQEQGADTAGPGRGARPAPAGEWIAGDLHVHSTYSHDSYGGPDDDDTEVDEFYTAGQSVEQAFRQAQLRGLDFLAISDHNDVRSQSDPGFGRFGVIGLPAYEKSLRGHAQMLGAEHVYEVDDTSAAGVTALADELRSDGGAFQINHPADASGDPEQLDWGYRFQVVPDTVEAWNIFTAYQPPFPAAGNNDAHLRYWEGWLDRGERVAAVGGSDSHWIHTSPAQGPGQPTTWVHVTDRSLAGIIAGLLAGRTTISSQPPAMHGVRVFLEADADRDGVWESMVGDTVRGTAALRARVEGGLGGLLQLHTDGGEPTGDPVPVTDDPFVHGFDAPAGATWVRADVHREDLVAARSGPCDPLVGAGTTYCRNRLVREAMTSAIFLTPTVPAAPPRPFG